MKEVLLTKEGLEELKERLNYLVVVKRKDVAEHLQHARSLGDLSENAEYDAAKLEQTQVEAEINELEEKIKYAVIIEKGAKNKVSIGSTVEVEFLGELDDDENSKMKFRIVGETEADFAKGLLSNESPLAKALLGKKEKEVVTVVAPHGEESYKILSIK